jgi:hypothetical protein
MNEEHQGQPEPTEVTVEIPLALRKLIQANTELLRVYQQELQMQIQEANLQMMEILKLSPDIGWKLDISRMVYTRPITEDEESK